MLYPKPEIYFLRDLKRLAKPIPRPRAISTKRGVSRSWDNDLHEPQHFLQNITHFAVVSLPSVPSPSTLCLTIFISIFLIP